MKSASAVAAGRAGGDDGLIREEAAHRLRRAAGDVVR